MIQCAAISRCRRVQPCFAEQLGLPQPGDGRRTHLPLRIDPTNSSDAPASIGMVRNDRRSTMYAGNTFAQAPLRTWLNSASIELHRRVGRSDQPVVLAIQGYAEHTPERFIVEISQPRIDLEIFQHCQHRERGVRRDGKSTSGYRARNGVVSEATIGSAVAIATIQRAQFSTR
jgi:hypothetical protein